MDNVDWGPRTPWSLCLILLGVINRSGPGRVQQPVTDFTGPWDDFMVHAVNSPLGFSNLDFSNGEQI